MSDQYDQIVSYFSVLMNSMPLPDGVEKEMAELLNHCFRDKKNPITVLTDLLFSAGLTPRVVAIIFVGITLFCLLCPDVEDLDSLISSLSIGSISNN